MSAFHYYVESNRPNVCIFCGGPPEHPHMAPLPPSFMALVATPCPDCLALAKVILDIFHHAQNGAELDAVWHTLDAFIKERER